MDSALAMLDAFASVGAQTFLLSFTDIEGHLAECRPTQRLPDLKAALPRLMERAELKQWNVIVRPRMPERSPVSLLQLDDLTNLDLGRVRSLAFLCITTSPNNNQAWLAISDSTYDIERRLKRGIGCDKHASGASRLAGSHNFKEKYHPDFPTVTLLESAPRRVIETDHLQDLGLLATPEHHRCVSRVAPSAARRAWPSYSHFMELSQGDRSRADFYFALTASRRDFTVEETASKLMELSEKAKENGERYAVRTAERAAGNSRR